MDTEYDFIQPEFLNLLVFQQKNLVVFPYVDLKHLRSLELFAVGYTVINLESTAISNLKDILEYEANNSYSQSKNLYFVYNLDRSQVKQILGITNFRCVLNTKENISDLVDGDNYVFYNKKVKSFLNCDFTDTDLEFETHLINGSKNESMIADNLQTLSSKALRIFNDLNVNGHLNNLLDILKDYDKKFWPKILRFVESFYQIKIPSNLITSYSQGKGNKSFLSEYELIMSLGTSFVKSFIESLHKFVQDNKEFDDLSSDFAYYPQELYAYLREHSWEEKISNEFVSNWFNLKNRYVRFSEKDFDDLQFIMDKSTFLSNSLSEVLEKSQSGIERKGLEYKSQANKNNNNSNPTGVYNFELFKKELLTRLQRIENFVSQGKIKKK